MMSHETTSHLLSVNFSLSAPAMDDWIGVVFERPDILTRAAGAADLRSGCTRMWSNMWSSEDARLVDRFHEVDMCGRLAVTNAGLLLRGGTSATSLRFAVSMITTRRSGSLRAKPNLTTKDTSSAAQKTALAPRNEMRRDEC